MNKNEPPAEDGQYTPEYFALPVPRSLGGPINILQSNGPHEYFHKTLIAKASSGVTKEMVFEALRRHATPGRPRDVPVSTDDFTDIDLARWLGPDRIELLRPDRVKHHVFPAHLTVVNTTVKGMHRLHPGNVSRRVVQEGDDIYVVTHGLGTGPRYYPLAGKDTGVKRVWQHVDEGIRDEFTPTTFDRRWRATSARPRFPDPTFNQRWDAIPDPVLQTARSWLDLSQDPAHGNLSPAPSSSETLQRQEGRRLQDIGVQDIGVAGPQDQDLPLPRSALAWMNLQNTPLGVLRAAVSPNAPMDVWNDVFAVPTLANDVLPAVPDVAGSGGAPALDAPFEQDPAAPNANMEAMTSLADLGRGYRNAGLGNSSFGNFADYGTGDFGHYGYGGLDRYGISIR